MATPKSNQLTGDKVVPFRVDDNYSNRRAMPRQPDPGKRDKEHYLKVAEAIYSAHLRNKGGILYKDQLNFAQNRLYAVGDQAKEKYIEYFFKESAAGRDAESKGVEYSYSVDAVGGWTGQTAKQRRKGWMNVLFDIVSDAPKIVATLVSKFEKAEYDIVCDAIDEQSGAEVENEKYKLWYMRENLKFYKEFYGNMGMEYQEPEFIPETEAELQLWEDAGGFKPAWAQVQEDIINHTLQYSNWPEVKKSMMTDAVTLGYFGCVDKWDSNSGKAKVEYIDPARLIIQYSEHRNHHDSQWAGHFKEVPLSHLAQKGFTPRELQDMASAYKGEYDNPSIVFNIREDGGLETDDLAIFKVCVLDFEYIDTDSQQYLVRDNEFGKKRVIKQDLGVKNKESDKQKTKVSDDTTKYRACWVVGTPYVYDYGKAYDITRPSPKEVNLSYHVYRLDTKPIIETLRPIFDNLMILWLKYQNALAMAINDGYAIDYDAISSIKMGAEKYSQEMVIKRFLQTGILIWKRRRAGNPGEWEHNKPIEHLNSNLQNAFMSFREGFNTNLMMIERLTGFTPMITGGSPAERAPVRNSEMAFDATNDFLRNILSGYLDIKENMAENVSLLVQLKVQQGWMSGYEKVIGRKAIEILKKAKANNAQYGISLEARPTDAQRSEIFESAKINLANGRDGKPGITEADYFKIIRIIEDGGSLRKAQMILEASIRRAKREAEEMAARSLQQQGQQNQALEQQKAQNELMKIKAEKDLEDRNNRNKAQWDKELEEIKSRRQPVTEK